MATCVRIYALVDPLSGEPRYVGKTELSLAARLRGHLERVRRGRGALRVAEWINSLRSVGHIPVMVLLDMADDAGWRRAERQWIVRGRRWGWSLLNVRPGGEKGYPGYKVFMPKEALALLGKVSDKEIGRRFGIDSGVVCYRRHKRGLPPAPLGGYKKSGPPHNKKSLPDDILARLGKEDDRTLAQEAGVSAPTICKARRARGIAPFSGRTWARAETHKSSKLSWEVVLFIRTAAASTDCNLSDLARQFNVTPQSIWAVVHNRSWRRFSNKEMAHE